MKRKYCFSFFTWMDLSYLSVFFQRGKQLKTLLHLYASKYTDQSMTLVIPFLAMYSPNLFPFITISAS